MSTPSEELAYFLKQNLERIFGSEKVPLIISVQSPREVEISANVSDLEAFAMKMAKGEASKHGVTIEEVRLNLREAGPRALELTANVRAKKMFFVTTVRITGRMEVDGQLAATVSNLNCTGEGAIGSMACGFLAPQLAKVDGQTVPLTAFLNSDISLRDVRLSTGEKIIVSVELNA
jgi:hypothetical protein